DSEGRRRFVLVALDIRRLVRLRYVELEAAVNSSIKLLLSPDQGELVVSYNRYEEVGGQPGWRNMVERYLAPMLSRVKAGGDLRLASVSGDLPSSISLSPSAHWIAAHRILDQTLITDEDGLVLQNLN